jgi:hypothetical protein
MNWSPAKAEKPGKPEVGLPTAVGMLKKNQWTLLLEIQRLKRHVDYLEARAAREQSNRGKV